MYADAQNKLHFMGTVQQPFGRERGPSRPYWQQTRYCLQKIPGWIKSVQLYPIPASNMAYLLIDHPYIGDIRISITGIAGVQLLQ